MSDDAIQPGDDEPVTHGQLRKLIEIWEPRLVKTEELLFEDLRDATGAIVRPSLQTVATMIHNHVTVVCQWAHGVKVLAKWTSAIVGAGVSLSAAAYSVYHLFGG